MVWIFVELLLEIDKKLGIEKVDNFFPASETIISYDFSNKLSQFWMNLTTLSSRFKLVCDNLFIQKIGNLSLILSQDILNFHDVDSVLILL